MSFMPGTNALLSCLARIESPLGISIEYIIAGSSFSMVLFGFSIPKPTRLCPPALPLYKPSIAASFIGCTFETCTAEPSPVHIVRIMPISPIILAILIEVLVAFSFDLRSSRKQLTPITNTLPSTQPLNTVCKNLLVAVGDNATSLKFDITFRACSGSNSIPTGFCIHAFAISIQRADMHTPIAVSHVAAR